MSLLRSLAISLLLTLIIELVTSLILGVRGKDNIIVIICANMCTNPIVVFIANCLVLLNNILIYNIRCSNSRNISCYNRIFII